MDEIKIKNLEVFANHGVFPEEKHLGQKFLVSATLYTDVRKAGRTDDLADSIDYGETCHFIESHMKERACRLIERAAETLAEELLLMTPNLKRIELEIEKPWAPIKLPLKSVSVRIVRSWHTAYVALGSNMGDKEGYLSRAVKELSGLHGCRVTKISSWVETEAYGVTDQPEFLNGCLELQTLLAPQELLEELHRIERDAGRVRKVHWGPRTLDLDVIFYDDLVMQSEELCIPHVDMHNRRFVLVPMCEIAPYMRHPVYGWTMMEGLAQLGGV